MVCSTTPTQHTEAAYISSSRELPWMSSSVATTQTYTETQNKRSMACVAEREAAVREVAQVYELIKLQQPLLLLQQPPPSTTQLAHSLLGKALRALNVALSVMKQPPPPPAVVAVKAEPHLSPPSPAASADSQAAIVPSTATRGAKRRRSSVPTEGKKKTSSSSEATLTAMPYDDGYEWRKYGEKKINGTLFTRSYFRCTYKEDAGCLATKYVQQMDDGSDPPMFHVTYNNDHTCNTSAKTAAAAIANNGSSNSNNLAASLVASCGNMKQEPSGHAAAAAAAMNMKQEPPLLLMPPLVPCDQMIPQCQEPLFPTNLEQQFVCGALRDHDSPVDVEISSATGSCISGETSWWDGYSGDMAAAEHDPLHDLERFLFMDY